MTMTGKNLITRYSYDANFASTRTHNRGTTGPA
jgi:hypothetical protein